MRGTALHCAAVRCPALPCAARRCVVLRCAALRRAALHCAARRYTALRGAARLPEVDALHKGPHRDLQRERGHKVGRHLALELPVAAAVDEGAAKGEEGGHIEGAHHCGVHGDLCVAVGVGLWRVGRGRDRGGRGEAGREDGADAPRGVLRGAGRGEGEGEGRVALLVRAVCMMGGVKRGQWGRGRLRGHAAAASGCVPGAHRGLQATARDRGGAPSER